MVFVTKFRHHVFSDHHLTCCEEIRRNVCAGFEAELAEFNGESNHVHLLVNFPPKVAVSKLVNSLKGVSSHRLRQEFPDLVQHYYRANKLWAGAYFAGSVGGAPLSIGHRYIEKPCSTPRRWTRRGSRSTPSPPVYGPPTSTPGRPHTGRRPHRRAEQPSEAAGNSLCWPHDHPAALRAGSRHGPDRYAGRGHVT
ncbi:ISSoc3, OrfA transposase [Streptomyces himastatinicus ATCC 53653]|uniref:ISSoc3, OrfA transposase n=1 Tax=Streptomyces himastatinicus ATCC 53653 TaxID=457427 RepID=D9WQH9_9ACTN|nr:ISSoc3, OrfA transposase [Streptomyces himastatinicus ATCC 53653]